MKIGIVGSRTFEEYSALKKFITDTIDIEKVKLVVSGGAIGADSLAKKFAKEYNIEMEEHIPEWNRFGQSAGFIRNTKIAEVADIIFAFWDGKSRGTKDTINKANVLGKKVHVFTFKREENG